MGRRRSGYAIWNIKNRAKVGDWISHRGDQWQIQFEGGASQFRSGLIQERLEKGVKWTAEWWEKHKDNPSMFNIYRYPYKIIKKKRQRDYKQYAWYQVVRKIVETSPSTQTRLDEIKAEAEAKFEAEEKRKAEYEARREKRIAEGKPVFPRRY